MLHGPVLIPEGHLLVAWVGILLGLLSGTGIGLCFHHDDWLGGYGAWSRRMVRLGHISFFGIAMLNIAYGLTMSQFVGMWTDESHRLVWTISGWAFVAGAALMPAVCFLSAWRKAWRHAFFVPVMCLVLAAGITTVNLFMGVLR